jgi:hypothetical protein
MGDEEKTMNKEKKTYSEVMGHNSFGSSIVSIKIKPNMLPCNGNFLPAIWQCHHSQVGRTTQVT